MQRRTALMAKLAAGAQNLSHGLMMLVAESTNCYRSVWLQAGGHLPAFHFTKNEDIYKHLRKRSENELSLWDATDESHLVLIGTFGVNVTGVAALEEAALLMVNHEWIPGAGAADNRRLAAFESARLGQQRHCGKYIAYVPPRSALGQYGRTKAPYRFAESGSREYVSV